MRPNVDVRRVAVAAAIFLLFASVPGYFYSTGRSPLHPSLLAVPIAAFCVAMGSGRILVPRRIAVWSVAFLAISAVSGFWSSGSSGAAKEMLYRLGTVLVLVGLVGVCSVDAYRLLARKAVAVGVPVAVLLNCYEFLHPSTFSVVIGRAAGFYRNPNASGYAIVLGTFTALPVIPLKWRLPYVMASGIGVYLTLSRSALVGWVLMVVVGGLLSKPRTREVIGFVVVMAALFWLMNSPQWAAFQANLVQRGLISQTKLFRVQSLAAFTGQDQSGELRVEAIDLAWAGIQEKPLWGHGLGSSTEGQFSGAVNEAARPHNIYVSLGYEQGLIGMLVFPALVFAMLVTREIRRSPVVWTFVLLALVEGYFDHLVMQSWPFLIAYAVVLTERGTPWLASSAPPPSGFRLPPITPEGVVDGGRKSRDIGLV